MRPSKSRLSAKERLLMEREYICVEQLAEMVMLSKKTVYEWNSSGYGPRVHKFCGRVRYLASEVEEWLERNDAA